MYIRIGWSNKIWINPEIIMNGNHRLWINLENTDPKHAKVKKMRQTAAWEKWIAAVLFYWVHWELWAYAMLKYFSPSLGFMIYIPIDTSIIMFAKCFKVGEAYTRETLLNC
jgi:hypothetical protein